jgi:hypothetical protein
MPAADTASFEAIIFYFDLIGVRNQFLDDPEGTMARIRDFQRRVRLSSFPFGGAHTTLKTMADNVWARINVSDENAIADVHVLEFAAYTMSAAREFGFQKYFGVVTRGEHIFVNEDRTLVGGFDPTDLRIQHIDMTSKPHIRAAFAEKWSAHLAGEGKLPTPPSCVWISEEVMPDGELEDQLYGLKEPFELMPQRIDLGAVEGPNGRSWPFPERRFRAITLPDSR